MNFSSPFRKLPTLSRALRKVNTRGPAIKQGISMSRKVVNHVKSGLTANLGAKKDYGPRSGGTRRGPGKHWLNKPAVVYRGKREICNPATPEGRAEYMWRKILLFIRQDGWCCFRDYGFCPGRVSLSEATFHHEDGRGAGKQDDRIWDEDRQVHVNGAAHLLCNSWCGSRRLEIWHGDNAMIDITPERNTS